MQGVLDGGGGDDCIVTFKDGPPYVSIGGTGNDTIVANVPPGTTTEQIEAICAGQPVSQVIPKVTAEIGAGTGGFKASLKQEGPPTDWTGLAAMLLVIVAAVALVRVLRRSDRPGAKPPAIDPLP